jgi:hypothetical protein
VNLIVIWDVDYRHSFTGLWLACPKAGATTRESVELYWQEPIPHPALLEVANEADSKGPSPLQLQRKTHAHQPAS